LAVRIAAADRLSRAGRGTYRVAIDHARNSFTSAFLPEDAERRYLVMIASNRNFAGNLKERDDTSGKRKMAFVGRLLIIAASLLMLGRPAQALLVWNWSYSGTGVSASGTFTTEVTPNADGFYQIVAITGSDNAVTITGLRPAGTAIPGNAPYAVDNFVRAASPQLTVHGFGFSLANGDYANPFYNGSTGYYEYRSVPPYVNGAGPETPVSSFSAVIAYASSRRPVTSPNFRRMVAGRAGRLTPSEHHNFSGRFCFRLAADAANENYLHPLR